MRYYLTKNALTKGIKVVEGTLFIGYGQPHVKFGQFGGCEKLNVHIFETKEQAIEKANEMRSKKISSLEKQIKKLEKLTFE